MSAREPVQCCDGPEEISGERRQIGSRGDERVTVGGVGGKAEGRSVSEVG